MHLRRALLLFAIVLGLAAVAASVSRPRGEGSDAPPASTAPGGGSEQPELAPGTAPAGQPPTTVMLTAERDQRRRIEAGQPATVEVAVPEAGMVEIPLLGLTAPGEPLTPARFDVLTRRPGRYPITFTPAETDQAEDAGTLVVVEPER